MAEIVNINKNPILLINALTQALSFIVYFNNGTKQYSQDVFHNSYIRLKEPLNNTNYFCIRKYTSIDQKEEEIEFGESAYNFQLYYEDDLINDQMFIMPLANGRIYTHTLKKGKIMAYRHTTYAGNSINEEIIYSANLLVIKGNPKLYGYTCTEYPNCTVTEKTEHLEPIEKINQYYVNKKLNAEGNVDVDINGESVAEIRKQYLSVVICDIEGSDPNNDECIYTIEINNQGNDIQLCPEKIFATSVIPGTNYFSVKISNHAQIKKLNITLNVLTGNAYMNIYSDYNNENKVNNYNHHKLFRKEVFEFNSGNIIERYWGEIICSEPAFIEMTYLTDFETKNYIMINPGEVNIEYINKKSILFPYMIENPHYYLPLNENIEKNKDFYFKIRTKECSMIFNYNNINMENITSIDMEFNRNQFNTYLKSYTFLSTVDNYNYNIVDDSTDCAMFVYSGEINSSENPLLIFGDYPLQSNFDNNYYIYPFFKGDKYFKGIIIDIKFIDINQGNPNYKLRLTVNGINIIEETNITKDEKIFIDGTNNTIDCGNNSQCVLKIYLNKNSNSDKTYNISLNVYTPDSSIPVTIDKGQNTNNAYISKGSSKIFKIEINKDEETEILLDFISGHGKVQMKLIQKNQIEDPNIYISEGDWSNLFNYANNGKITITKEQSNMCDGGCELLLLIQMDDNIEQEYGEISINKIPLTQETSSKKDDNNKKIDAWLTAVLCIVCAVVVAGVLILVYFLVLRRKNNNIPTRTNYAINTKQQLKYNNYYGNNTNPNNYGITSKNQINNTNNNTNKNYNKNINNNYNIQNNNKVNNNINRRVNNNINNNYNNKANTNINNNYNIQNKNNVNNTINSMVNNSIKNSIIKNYVNNNIIKNVINNVKH